MKRLTSYSECTHRPETGTMVCRWLREVTPVEMRRSYEYLLAQAQEVGSRRWLLDIRRRNEEDPETAHWLQDEFMPRLAVHVNGPTFLAYLLSPTHLRRVDADALAREHVAQLQRSVHVALFSEESGATEWLGQQAGKN
jgi:hypothetical protein